MKQFLPQPYYALLGLILLALFFTFRNPNNAWDRVIQAEGLGYYAYLPAIFIHHDLSWESTALAAQPYYNRDVRGDFLNKIDQKGINKYFPGIAILWLPFFWVAHFLSFLTGMNPDGFGLLYQYSIAFSAIFYLLLGLKYCEGMLKELSLTVFWARLSSLLILLGSNLLYNTLGVASQSHVYSFFLLSGVLFHGIRYFRLMAVDKRDVIFASLYLSIAFCIRPTDILVLLSLPFFIAVLKIPINSLRLFISNIRHLSFAAFSFLLPIALTMLLWYLQTESFIADSYVGEHFYFANPQLSNFLFSFRKGWLTYHPIFYFSFVGLLILLFQQNRAAFFSGFLFVFMLVYVFSSWWIWTYSVPFGQRVMIDFYPFFIFLFGLALKYLNSLRLKIFVSISLLLVTFNLWRTYQYQKGIIPWEYVTSKLYFSTIFDGGPVARYLVNEPRIVDRKTLSLTPLENGLGRLQTETSIRNVFQTALPSFDAAGIRHLRVNTTANCPKISGEVRIDLVLFFEGKEVRRESRFANDYFHPGKFTPICFGFEFAPHEKADSLVYQLLYGPNAEPVLFGNVQIELMAENEIPEFVP
jgi:hypothetical protein